jgi:hypothetical protein
MKPVIHANGTPAGILLRQYLAAHTALQRAMDALAHAAPHGRDYYPAGPAAFAEADKAHRNNVEALERVRLHLMDMAEHCDSHIKHADIR